MFPTIGLVQVGAQSMADRYTYLPQIGLFIALVWGGAMLADRWTSIRKPLLAVACLFAGIMTISTAYQLRYWQNTNTLYTHALEVTDHNATAYMSVALWLTFENSGDQAIPYYYAALKLGPKLVEEHNNLGALLLERGDIEGAYNHLSQAVEYNPSYAEARNNFGNVLSRMGRLPEALQQYEESVRLNPDSAEAHYNLAMTLSQAGKFDQAASQFAWAIRLRPHYVQAHFGYALALLANGQLDPAKRQLERFLELKPDGVDEMAQFAWALATSADPRSRDPKGAVSLAEHVNQLTLSDNATYLDTLAAAYASAGAFDGAIAAATRARNLAQSRGQAKLADLIAKRIELYQAHQPFVLSTQPALPIPPTNPENSNH
jgi:tetratricopeptide (TPR) repeat protein